MKTITKRSKYIKTIIWGIINKIRKSNVYIYTIVYNNEYLPW